MFKIDVHLHFDGAKEIAKLLQTNQRERLDEIVRTLNKIKEISMKTQADIDKLTAEVEANTSGVKEAILSESAEIKAAIDSSQIDTTALEAAVAENQKLADAVKDIFTAEPGEPETTETGEEETVS